MSYEYICKTNRIDYHISQKITLRRAVLGLSRQDIAEALDISVQQVEKYEKSARFNLKSKSPLSIFLQSPVDYFFEPASAKYSFGESEVSFDMSALKNSGNRLLKKKEADRMVKHFLSISNIKIRQKLMELIESLSVLT